MSEKTKSVCNYYTIKHAKFSVHDLSTMSAAAENTTATITIKINKV